MENLMLTVGAIFIGVVFGLIARKTNSIVLQFSLFVVFVFFAAYVSFSLL